MHLDSRLPSGLSPTGFSITKFYVFLVASRHAKCSSHIIPNYIITNNTGKGVNSV